MYVSVCRYVCGVHVCVPMFVYVCKCTPVCSSLDSEEVCLKSTDGWLHVVPTA